MEQKRGQLVCELVNLNDRIVVGTVLKSAILELKQTSNWRVLQVHATDQFRTDTKLPSSPGWYVIVDESGRPLYVGQAEDLDSRLNSSTGSQDNFNNSTRTSDPARNFIKYLTSNGMIEGLKVGIIEEVAVLSALDLETGLSKLDRGNVEKLLGIFRTGIVPKQIPTLTAG